MNEQYTICAEKINITSLVKAHQTLKEALTQAQTQLERDGVIQRFEFTYELFWKTLKKVLLIKGVESNNPHDVFRDAAKNKLIDDPRFWFEVIRKRNLTSHVYNQRMADEIYDFIPQFEASIARVISIMRSSW